MQGLVPASAALAAALFFAGCGSPEAGLQRALNNGSGSVRLPGSVIEIHRGLTIPAHAENLEIAGSPGAVLQAAPDFQGRAILSCDGCRKIRIHGFALDGARSRTGQPVEIPPSETPFAGHFAGNGILLENAEAVEISDVTFREIQGFAVLAAGSRKVDIRKVTVSDSGSRDARGRNNTTGGILFEEGCDDFEVAQSVFRNILGNGVWTHSRYHSRRNTNGLFAGNRLENIGRDALQAGHAGRIEIRDNRGANIGFPHDVVDIERSAVPVALDTAGNVEESIYRSNSFEEVNGKCIDLDGFHHGEVSGNSCVNRGSAGDYPHGQFGIVVNDSFPEMHSESIVIRDNVIDGFLFGGIFLIGSGHVVAGNKLRNLNLAGCPDKPAPASVQCVYNAEEPRMLYSGIYLGRKVSRHSPSRSILVENNAISGYRMKEFCVTAAPTIRGGDNTIRNNTCSDSAR